MQRAAAISGGQPRTARRYVIVETVIGVVISVVLDVMPAAIAFRLHAPVIEPAPRALVAAALPQFVITGLMNTLVPVLLTRWRHRAGTLGLHVHAAGPGLVQIVGAAAAMMVISGAAGAAFLTFAFPHLAGPHPGPGAVLTFYGGFGGLTGAIVTPTVLLGFYRRGWQ